MVIDARRTNRRHKPPPVTRLASPSALVELDLSDEALSCGGTGGILDVGVTGNEADVVDCFYNFEIPMLCSWFAINEGVTVRELKAMNINISKAWSDSAGGLIGVKDDLVVFPC